MSDPIPCRSSRCRHRGDCARNPSPQIGATAPAPVDASERPRCFEAPSPVTMIPVAMIQCSGSDGPSRLHHPERLGSGAHPVGSAAAPPQCRCGTASQDAACAQGQFLADMSQDVSASSSLLSY